MQISELTLNGNMFNLSNLLGTGAPDLLQQINRRAGGGSFFGSMADPFREGFQSFMNQVIEPIRQCGVVLQNVATSLFNSDQYRPITSVKELERGIPPCMQMGVVCYEPLRTMLNEERIDGFGLDPNKLPAEDPYKRICESGNGTIHSTLLSKEGTYNVEFEWCSADPELTPEQAMDLQLTREFIDLFLKDEKTRHMDFTDYPALHG